MRILAAAAAVAVFAIAAAAPQGRRGGEAEVKIIKGCKPRESGAPWRKGVFADARDCHKYVHCFNGTEYYYKCYDGFVFSPCEKRCVFQAACIPAQKCSERVGFLFLPGDALDPAASNAQLQEDNSPEEKSDAHAEDPADSDDTLFVTPDQEIQILEKEVTFPDGHPAIEPIVAAPKLSAEPSITPVIKESEIPALPTPAPGEDIATSTMMTYVVRVVFSREQEPEVEVSLPQLPSGSVRASAEVRQPVQAAPEEEEKKEILPAPTQPTTSEAPLPASTDAPTTEAPASTEAASEAPTPSTPAIPDLLEEKEPEILVDPLPAANPEILVDPPLPDNPEILVDPLPAANPEILVDATPAANPEILIDPTTPEILVDPIPAEKEGEKAEGEELKEDAKENEEEAQAKLSEDGALSEDIIAEEEGSGEGEASELLTASSEPEIPALLENELISAQGGKDEIAAIEDAKKDGEILAELPAEEEAPTQLPQELPAEILDEIPALIPDAPPALEEEKEEEKLISPADAEVEEGLKLLEEDAEALIAAQRKLDEEEAALAEAEAALKAEEEAAEVAEEDLKKAEEELSELESLPPAEIAGEAAEAAAEELIDEELQEFIAEKETEEAEEGEKETLSLLSEGTEAPAEASEAPSTDLSELPAEMKAEIAAAIEAAEEKLAEDLEEQKEKLEQTEAALEALEETAEKVKEESNIEAEAEEEKAKLEEELAAVEELGLEIPNGLQDIDDVAVVDPLPHMCNISGAASEAAICACPNAAADAEMSGAELAAKCAGLRCRNGGMYMHLSSGHCGCVCQKGYKGAECELLVEESKCGCHNGAACVSVSGGAFACHCSLGFFGDRCQFEVESVAPRAANLVQGAAAHRLGSIASFLAQSTAMTDEQKSWQLTKSRRCLNGGLPLRNRLTQEIKCFCQGSWGGQFCGTKCHDC